MTAVSPLPEATHPPETAGEGTPPAIEPGTLAAAEADGAYASSTLVMPTVRIAGVILAIGLISILLPASIATPLAILGFAAVIAGVISDVFTLPRRSKLTLRRNLPEVFSLGHLHPFELVIGSMAMNVKGSVVQTGIKGFEVLTEGEDSEPPGGFPQEFKARRNHAGEVKYLVRPRLRGRHVFAPAVLIAKGRFGLASKRFIFNPRDEIHVYPDLDDVKRAEMALRRSRFLETGLRSRRFIGEGTEFESLREYHPDDDIRHINWHATARHRVPITNQFRIDRNQTVITLIDCGRLMSTPVGNFSRLDIALANAAGVAHVCGKLEDRIGALAFDSTIRADLPARRGNVQNFLAALYDLEPSFNESDFELAFARVAAQKRALVMVFTDILDEAAARPIIAAAPALVRRHQVLVCSVRDPEIDAAMSLYPEDKSDAYRQAGALGVLEHRSIAIRELARRGVGVVEAPPEEMTTALINSYLKLKARLRL
ncbi:MAG: hypothetical protein DCC49_09595 [Acidobacteria bacterium]|nr:MAG: hypothetical protein DCC49_09595 [Acidobacteriota bacterium]